MMKRFRFMTLAALLVLPLAACDEGTTVAPAADGAISGTVNIDGAGAAGVTVSLSNGQTATTNASGQYSFPNVPTGAYTVTISGYPADVTFPSTTQAAVVSSAGQTAVVNFSGARIMTSAIFVSVNSGGAPVAGATVTITGAASRTGQTDGNGQGSFGGLPAGNYTVAISGLPTGVNCTTTSQTATLAAGETKIVSFACSPSNTGTISGRLFLDENDKNNVFDGAALEEGLPAANVAITLEGPSVGVTQTTQTDENGQYSFTNLGPGSYNVTIASTDPDLPDDVEYGGTATTFPVTLTAGGSAAVNFPFDITEQALTVYAFLGVDETNPGIAPVEGVIIDLFPSEFDAIAGTNRLGRDTTDAEGEILFLFDRADDTSPAPGVQDQIVFAQFVSAPNAFHELNGETRIEIHYDPRFRTATAPDTFDLLNTRVTMKFDAMGASGGALAGWNAALWLNDTTGVAVQSVVTDSAGRAVFSDAVASSSLPDTFYMRLSGAQPAALGHQFMQQLVAERGTVVGSYLRYIHRGLSATSDTVDVGDAVVTFADADLMVRVYHEADDSLYGGPPRFTAGDNVENADNIQVTLTWPGMGNTQTVAASSVDGTATFTNIPTNVGPYTLTARSTAAGQVVLMDTLVTVGVGNAGDMSGGTAATLVCPLGDNTFADCATFAYKYQNGSITGTVRSADGTDADGLKVRVQADPRTIQGQPLDTTLVVMGGSYALANVREGYYIVSIADSVTASGTAISAWVMNGATVTGNKADTVDVEGNVDNDIVNFRAVRHDTQIQGVVVNDRDADLNTIDPGEALEGVVIRLYRDNTGAEFTLDSLVAETTTNANGAYTFTGLREARYAIQAVSPANAMVLRRFTSTGAKVDTAIVTTGATTTGLGADGTRTVGTTSPSPLPRWNYDTSTVDFDGRTHFTFLYNTTTATGTVATAGGTPVPGMVITLRRCDDSAGSMSPPAAGNCTTYFSGFSPINQSTDAAGRFTFSNLQEGVYEVTPNATTAGYTSTTPAQRLFLLVGPGDVETGNFVAN